MNLEEIYKLKNSDIAIMLGCGPSINNITNEQWKFIKTVDTWTVNNWIYHPFFVPKFYHLELKSYDLHIFSRRIIEKSNQYNMTNFIINKERKHIIDALNGIGNLYLYKMNKIHSLKSFDIPYFNFNSNLNILTCVLNASMTMILEIFYKFKYKKVIFFGVDMYDRRYFWTGKDNFGETHCQWNKDHENSDINTPHNTAHIKNYIVWFSKNKMSKIGCELFVGNKDTILYPDLRFIKI